MKNTQKKLMALTFAACAVSMMTVGASAANPNVISGNGRINMAVISNIPGMQGMNQNELQQILGQHGPGCNLDDLLAIMQGGKCPELPGNGQPPVNPNPGRPIYPILPDQPNLPEDNKPGDGPSEDVGNVDAFVKEVVALVNKERAAANLSPVKLDSKVQAAASVRAREQQTLFSHTRPNGSDCFTALAEAGASYRGSGENIAYGQRTPAEVMNGWMNSSGHRANILNPQFENIGVGVYQGSNGTLYWAQMFTY